LQWAARPDKAADGGTSSDTSKNAGSDKLALQQDVQIVGAGASFPAPLYQRWFQDLNGQYPKLQVNTSQWGVALALSNSRRVP
jgi:phosphate transport system substrate-binding protein